MTIVSNDPAWWPAIDWNQMFSYFALAASATVVYDYALSFAQEFELIWRHRWSFMTVLYICVRYVGILYSVVVILWSLPFSIADKGCNIFLLISSWTPVVINAMLGVIMMNRIYAMYQRSRKVLILLAVLLTSTIASGSMTGVSGIGGSGEEFVLSGNHFCGIVTDIKNIRLSDETLIPITIWEILALFLAAWIAIKHFCELRQSSTTSTIGDCFTVLIQSHVLYFVAFVAVSCFNLGALSPNIQLSSSTGAAAYAGIYEITQMVQMFVLGPRLILSIREFHAKLVADSDEGTAMTTIDFEARGHVSTGGDV